MVYSFLRYDKDGVLLDIEAFEDESILKDWSYLFEGKQVHSVDDSFILHLKIFCYDVISKFFIISIISTKTIGAKFIKLCEGCGIELEKISKENKEDRWFHE